MSQICGHAAVQMEAEQSYMTEMICDLALEIIYLQTGEKHAAVKMASIEGLLRGMYPPMPAGDSLKNTANTKPPSRSQTSERNSQKILEVANKIIELLAAEVSNNIKIIEIKEEPEERCVSGEEWCTEKEASPKCSSKSTQKDSKTPLQYQDEDLELDIKQEEVERVAIAEQCEENADPHNSAEWGHTQKESPNVITVGGLQSDDIASDSSDRDVTTSNLNLRRLQEKTVTWSKLCFSEFTSNIGQKKILPDEKPYTCSECGKCFAHIASLIGHEQAHLGVKPYECPECGKCFSQKLSLISHKRVHREKRPYTCAVCGRCFYQKSHLTGHERVHTGEKPFPCAQCGKCFSDRTVLVRHERVHTGEKPYSCSECGRCFSQKANLMRHEQTHAGKNPSSVMLGSGKASILTGLE